MKRNISTLANNDWDVLVIGGGISGAGVAWEAATRGLRTALIEKGDFGAATSSGCFRIIHGGIRYLQHFDFRRLWESVEEQKFLRRAAPHLVHPFPFLVPCYSNLKKSRSYIGLGAFLYDFMTTTRNRGIDPDHILPHPQILSRNAVMKIAPGLPTDGLTGGVVFYDCSIYHCERLTLGVVKSAADAGAAVTNYAQVTGFDLTQDVSSCSIDRVKIKDLITGQDYSLKARLIVNSAGPWIPTLNQELAKALEQLSVNSASVSPVLNFTDDVPDVAREQVYSKGVQLVLPQVLDNYALAIESSQSDYSAIVNRGARSYFLIPWRGATLLGTSEQLYRGDPESYGVTEEDIANLLQDAKRGYRSELIERTNVKHVFGGLRQLDAEFFVRGQQIGEAPPSKIDQIIDYAMLDKNSSGVNNLISVGCVKYTTFRAVAERTVDLIAGKLKAGLRPSVTSHKLLSGGVLNWKEFATEAHRRLDQLVPQEVAQRIICEFGSASLDIADELEQTRSQSPYIEGTSVTRAELSYSLQNEMPQTALDLILRRSALGVYGYPGKKAVEGATAICSEALGWDKEKELEQIRAVRSSLV